jgi:hypothetical protein
MAKKAPAKRKPNELEANRENYSRLAEKLEVARKPAKRKPRPKKPVVPSNIQTVTEYVHVPMPTGSGWIAIPAFFVAFVLGIGLGIWICGGIPVGPDNKPEPTPTPVPEPDKSFRVIFVKESGQTLSGEQVAIPGAKEIRDYLTAKTTQEGGQVGWREYDPQQQTANEQPTMKKLWETAKPSLLPAPCLIVEVNGKATVMPFPKTVAEAVETLKKAGG